MDACSHDEMGAPHISGRPVEVDEPLYRFGRAPRTVLVLAFDNITLSDVAGPTDVFDLVRQVFSETELEIGANPYRVIVGSVHGVSSARPPACCSPRSRWPRSTAPGWTP